jgi:hypothetical protein
LLYWIYGIQTFFPHFQFALHLSALDEKGIILLLLLDFPCNESLRPSKEQIKEYTKIPKRSTVIERREKMIGFSQSTPL